MESGQEEPLHLSVESLVMSDGTEVSIPPGGVVTFVGPNNSGKSTALQDLSRALNGQQGEIFVPTALREIRWKRRGDTASVERWLDAYANRTEQDGRAVYARRHTDGLRLDSATHFWSAGPPFGSLGAMMMFYADPLSRANAVQSVENIDSLTQAPTRALQYLCWDASLERRLRSISQEAFGVGIAVNRHAGRNIHLHFGEPPLVEVDEGVPTKETLARWAALPMAEAQGHGVRSYLGLMMELISVPDSVVIIDEPETFLHPPQAALLGAALVREKPADAQLFIATHSADVLRGILSVHAVDLTVVRLSLRGAEYKSDILEPSDVRMLWDLPLLRYSQTLEALVHQRAVICEGDADCRFYAAALDVELRDRNVRWRPEIQWLHCGGKSRMDQMARALAKVAVPVTVIADFDVIRGKTVLPKLVDALGGDWSLFEPDWATVNAVLDALESEISAEDIRGELQGLLEKLEPPVEVAWMEAVRRAVAAKGGWALAKRGGLAALPAEANAPARNLLELCANIGIHIVEVGELEGWLPGEGHGPAYVSAALEDDHLNTENAAAVRAFVSRVVALQ